MAYGTDPRDRQMTKEDILRQQIDSRYDPYINESFENMGRGNEEAWRNYGNINQGYDTIMGMPPAGGQPVNRGYAAPTQAPSLTTTTRSSDIKFDSNCTKFITASD